MAPEVLDHFYKCRLKCVLSKQTVLKLGVWVADWQDKTGQPLCFARVPVPGRDKKEALPGASSQDETGPDS